MTRIVEIELSLDDELELQFVRQRMQRELDEELTPETILAGAAISNIHRAAKQFREGQGGASIEVS